MTRRAVTAPRLLLEARVVQLASELLRRGARTRTVERLTGLKEHLVRIVHHEMYQVGPHKGPSARNAEQFTANQRALMQSNLARVCIDATLPAQECSDLPRPPELAAFYIKAYDLYLDHAKPLEPLSEPMTFEAFSMLALFLAGGKALKVRSCSRCTFEFVSDDGFGLQRNFCANCRINTSRGCKTCSAYVPLDTLDLQPRRRPACDAHVSRPRRGFHGRPQYAAVEDSADLVAAGRPPASAPRLAAARPAARGLSSLQAA